MGLWDSIKKLTKPYEDEYLDDELEETSRSPFARQESRSYMDYAAAPAAQENSVRHTFMSSMRSASERGGTERSAAPSRGSVDLSGGGAPMKLLVMKPERFADAAGIADSMRERSSVFLNLESMSPEEARRLVDFVSGAAYIQGGKIRRIAANTFIVTPANVDLSGDVLSSLDGRVAESVF